MEQQKEKIMQAIQEGRHVLINKKRHDLEEFFKEVRHELLDNGVFAVFELGNRVNFTRAIGGTEEYFTKMTPEIRFGNKDVVIIYGKVDKRWRKELKEYIRNSDQIFVEVSNSKKSSLLDVYNYIEL